MFPTKFRDLSECRGLHRMQLPLGQQQLPDIQERVGHQRGILRMDELLILSVICAYCGETGHKHSWENPCKNNPKSKTNANFIVDKLTHHVINLVQPTKLKKKTIETRIIKGITYKQAKILTISNDKPTYASIVQLKTTKITTDIGIQCNLLNVPLLKKLSNKNLQIDKTTCDVLDDILLNNMHDNQMTRAPNVYALPSDDTEMESDEELRFKKTQLPKQYTKNKSHIKQKQ
ncbi:hypothetical protein HELRODRAFT_183950 [Helobdella robusta]|uniref:Uncharacterized protein n=1 Tax=Helobdella robusta TaxID=6412 RepID=T1FKC3_HELRO|nr:hypothetical protein HELRODRAFT_183950 [Helobdella robusta]ESO09682.1 hypothetical protein HELRODRAFT_183950 [Helobdella robusta]